MGSEMCIRDRRDCFSCTVCVPHACTLCTLPAMASTSPGRQQRERTSVPLLYYKSKKKSWVLRLWYTPPKKRPVNCTSRLLDSREEAEAGMHSWRLIWGLGYCRKPMEERSIEAAKQAAGCGSAASASTWNPTLPQGVAVILFQNEVNTVPK